MTYLATELPERLARIREGIERACERAGRAPDGVRLVAACKTVPAERVREAWEAGVRDFGENYVNEMIQKRPAAPDATWHYIGTLQSHTAHRVADHADVVETLSGKRATERLAGRAARAGRAIPSLIEVDLTGERTGVAPQDVPAFAESVASMDGIRLVGLMTLPPMPVDPDDTRPYFRRLRGLRDRLREKDPDLVELSMGMSLDYEAAVEEGATMVRIGTALFGERA